MSGRVIDLPEELVRTPARRPPSAGRSIPASPSPTPTRGASFRSPSPTKLMQQHRSMNKASPAAGSLSPMAHNANARIADKMAALHRVAASRAAESHGFGEQKSKLFSDDEAQRVALAMAATAQKEKDSFAQLGVVAVGERTEDDDEPDTKETDMQRRRKAWQQKDPNAMVKRKIEMARNDGRKRQELEERLKSMRTERRRKVLELAKEGENLIDRNKKAAGQWKPEQRELAVARANAEEEKRIAETLKRAKDMEEAAFAEKCRKAGVEYLPPSRAAAGSKKSATSTQQAAASTPQKKPSGPSIIEQNKARLTSMTPERRADVIDGNRQKHKLTAKENKKRRIMQERIAERDAALRREEKEARIAAASRRAEEQRLEAHARMQDEKRKHELREAGVKKKREKDERIMQMKKNASMRKSNASRTSFATSASRTSFAGSRKAL